MSEAANLAYLQQQPYYLALEDEIEVRATSRSVSDINETVKSHQLVRKIGRDYNALIVIWGSRVGQKSFHPRLTIVHNIPNLPMLEDYDSLRQTGVSRKTHEDKWEKNQECRNELKQVRHALNQYADMLAEITKIKSIHVLQDD